MKSKVVFCKFTLDETTRTNDDDGELKEQKTINIDVLSITYIYTGFF